MSLYIIARVEKRTLQDKSDLACSCLLSIIRTVYISYNEVTPNSLSSSLMVALAVLAIITTPGSVVESIAEKVSCSS